MITSGDPMVDFDDPPPRKRRISASFDKPWEVAFRGGVTHEVEKRRANVREHGPSRRLTPDQPLR